MSIKSWIDSMAKKREKKEIKKIVEYYKYRNIRTVRLDVEGTLYFVTNEGRIRENVLMFYSFRGSVLRKHKKIFLTNPVPEYDRVFGVHRRRIEDGKVTLVWYVQ